MCDNVLDVGLLFLIYTPFAVGKHGINVGGLERFNWHCFAAADFGSQFQ